jgi:hypothetical protein
MKDRRCCSKMEAGEAPDHDIGGPATEPLTAIEVVQGPVAERARRRRPRRIGCTAFRKTRSGAGSTIRRVAVEIRGRDRAGILGPGPKLEDGRGAEGRRRPVVQVDLVHGERVAHHDVEAVRAIDVRERDRAGVGGVGADVAGEREAAGEEPLVQVQAVRRVRVADHQVGVAVGPRRRPRGEVVCPFPS